LNIHPQIYELILFSNLNTLQRCKVDTFVLDPDMKRWRGNSPKL